eukprot:4864271-Prymnesium_polylepis.1
MLQQPPASPAPPRSFAGKRNADVMDFVDSYVHKISKITGARKTPLKMKAADFAQRVGIMGGIDLGTMEGLQRKSIATALKDADCPPEWCDAFESLLDIKFQGMQMPSSMGENGGPTEENQQPVRKMQKKS